MRIGIIGLFCITSIFAQASSLAVCVACHGDNFEKKAIGVSKVVKDMTKEEIVKALKGYKNGTYGKSLSMLMKGQIEQYSDAELEEFANDIKKQQSLKSKETKSLLVKRVAKCATEESDASRLICYDALADYFGVQKPKTTTTTDGKWLVTESKSKIDDSVTVTLMLNSSETITTSYHQEVYPVMVLRCAENRTNAYVDWQMFLGMDSTRVLTRLDKQKARTRTWLLSTDNKATFAPKNIGFIKSMFGHEKILMQLTPYGESPRMATFEIGGLKEAIKPLRKACGW